MSTSTKAGRCIHTKKRWIQTRAGRETIALYCFISPWVIGFVVLTVVIMLAGLMVTFTSYDGIMALSDVKWWGFRNYLRIAQDIDDLKRVFGNTVTYTALVVPLSQIFALALASILNQEVQGRDIFRTLYYLPRILPAVAVVVAWKVLMDKNFGLVNAVLSWFRPGTAINWLSNEYIRYILIMMALWGGVGGGMVIYLAGLQGIPDELREAAMIDGANVWQVFRHVTMPLLTPVMFFQFTHGIVGAMQVLTQPILLSTALASSSGVGGALATQPRRSVEMWSNFAMRQVFGNYRYGYGVVLLWMMFVIVGIISALNFSASRYWVYYDD
jgi:multiple sugar transport system permease protein